MFMLELRRDLHVLAQNRSFLQIVRLPIKLSLSPQSTAPYFVITICLRTNCIRQRGRAPINVTFGGQCETIMRQPATAADDTRGR